MLANYSLILLLQWNFDYEQVEEVGLRAVLLVVGLARASSQLGLLSTGIILEPETDETVWPEWIVLDRDLRDEQPL